MAIQKKSTAVVVNDEDEGSVGTAVKPEAGEGQAPKAGAKAKPEPEANEELVGLFEKYDQVVEQAETYFIEMVEHIQKNQLDRATVVKSMMKARGITYETAQSQYSRMKKIFNNEEVLKDLKEGNITLKVAREKTVSGQKNPKAAKPEAKEARFTNTLKAFAGAAKESGFTLKEIMVSVEAAAQCPLFL